MRPHPEEGWVEASDVTTDSGGLGNLSTLLGLISRDTLLVNATVVCGPLGGKVASLHQKASAGLARDELEHLVVGAHIGAAAARPDLEATV